MTTLIETMRASGGRFPLGAWHRRRLAASAAALGIPWDPATFPKPPDHGVVRLTVGPHGTATTTHPFAPLAPPSIITTGITHPGYPHKTTDRAAFDAARAEALARGADDALLLDADGLVAEGPTWTVYWWHEETLYTPSLAVGVLPGVARGAVRDAAAAAGIPWREVRERRSALDERSLFLSNAVRGVVPIGRIDGRTVPSDPRTARLALRF